MFVLTLHSSSARETKNWGRRLASLLSGGELLGLSGELGAGKTCFVKGLARGLHLQEERILSPTFTIIQEHEGRLPFYHIDLYRMEETGIDELGLREYLFSSGVAAVEWFERLREAPQLNLLQVRISYDGANFRKIELIASDERYTALLQRLQQQFL
jgi:tRNA threonylcarbamoyladenosine biosynthesis protein TsaE